jgi:hypothetical protein
MNPTSKQTPAQRIDMIEMFLRMYKGRTFDGMTARQWMIKVWGIDYDWHDFAIALDHIRSYGKATVTRRGEVTEYMID